MKEKLVILGATEYVNPLIEKGIEMGYETHVFAWETGDVGEKTADYFYPISIRNKEEILKVCQNINPAGIVTLGSDLAAVTAAYLTEALGLPGNGYEDTRRTVNKISFRRLMQENGITQPNFVSIGDRYSTESSRKISFPVVVKPSDRSASRGVKKISTRERMFKAVVEAREMSNEGKVIVEEYIFGRHFSCECISQNGEHHILAYTKRDNAENLSGFIEHLHSEPANLTESQKKRIDSHVTRILDICNIKNGASSVEFLLGSREEIVVLEITPSMYGDFIGTDLVASSTGYDYMKLAIDVACGKDIRLQDMPENNHVKVQIILTSRDMEDLRNLRENSPEKVIKYKLFTEESEVPDKINDIRYGYFIYKD